jgi:hypothetical protein
MEVRKRNGEIINFDLAKIVLTIQKALDSVGLHYEPNDLRELAKNVLWRLIPPEEVIVSVDQIHFEIIRHVLMESYPETFHGPIKSVVDKKSNIEYCI